MDQQRRKCAGFTERAGQAAPFAHRAMARSTASRNTMLVITRAAEASAEAVAHRLHQYRKRAGEARGVRRRESAVPATGCAATRHAKCVLPHHGAAPRARCKPAAENYHEIRPGPAQEIAQAISARVSKAGFWRDCWNTCTTCGTT